MYFNQYYLTLYRNQPTWRLKLCTCFSMLCYAWSKLPNDKIYDADSRKSKWHRLAQAKTIQFPHILLWTTNKPWPLAFNEDNRRYHLVQSCSVLYYLRQWRQQQRHPRARTRAKQLHCSFQSIHSNQVLRTISDGATVSVTRTGQTFHAEYHKARQETNGNDHSGESNSTPNHH